MNPPLPAMPVILWKQERAQWLLALLGVFLLTDTTLTSDRSVEMSVNGLMVRGPGAQFISWPEIDAIAPADEPDFACVQLHDGSHVTLDRWHVPFRGRRRLHERTVRLQLLQSALQTAKAADTPRPAQ